MRAYAQHYPVLPCAGDAKKDVVALASTVQHVLAQAAGNGLQSVAMPLIRDRTDYRRSIVGWPAEAHLQGLLQFVAAEKNLSVLKVTVTWPLH